jgi:flagellar motor switch protein FliM
MEPLVGLALIALAPDFVFFLIDCMLGGAGKSMNQVREFTLIEQRIIKKFVGSVLKNMEKAWGVACSIKTSLRKIETKPQFVHLVVPTDLVIVTVFAINGDDFSGHLYLCIPYFMLEPIKEELSYKSMREVELESSHNPHLQHMLKQTNVMLSAELGKAIHTVGDLLNIQAGDVIKLNTGPQDRITVAVEEVPKYQGVPGVVKGNRAVQVTALLQQNGGANNHELGG